MGHKVAILSLKSYSFDIVMLSVASLWARLPKRYGKKGVIIVRDAEFSLSVRPQMIPSSSETYHNTVKFSYPIIPLTAE